MSWIESHQSLSRHRKTIRLVAILKCDRHKVIGHLHELWWWALDNATIDGELTGLTAEEIAHGAEWPLKDAERFIDALVTAGFLERRADGFVLHDWYEFAGKLLAKRASNKERMRVARAAHVQRTNDARAEHVHGLPTVPTIPTTTVHETRTDDADGDIDVGFRDRLGTMLIAIGGTPSEKNLREYRYIAEDRTQADIDVALKGCALEGVRPWPNEIAKRLPKTTKAEPAFDFVN